MKYGDYSISGPKYMGIDFRALIRDLLPADYIYFIHTCILITMIKACLSKADRVFPVIFFLVNDTWVVPQMYLVLYNKVSFCCTHDITPHYHHSFFKASATLPSCIFSSCKDNVVGVRL